MDAQFLNRRIRTFMEKEFEGAPWSWLVDPDGGGSAQWMAEAGTMAEAFAPTDSFPQVEIRVVVHCNDPSGDGRFPQLHIKCGVLKEIPAHPDLLPAVNQLNGNTIFGRLQLHTGRDGDRAITAEHFLMMHHFDGPSMSTGLQLALDTLSFVRNQCAGKAAHELRPAFGGRPFSDENDGAVIVMAGI